MLAAYAGSCAAAIDREHLEHAAAQADALEAANELRTAILSAVSHDLRTPLAAIKASVTSLRQEDVEWTPEARHEFLTTVEEEADRLNALVGQPPRHEPAAGRGAERRTCSRLGSTRSSPRRSSASDRVARASTSSARRLCRDVSADPGLLERALANIVDNAVAFSPAAAAPGSWAGRLAGRRRTARRRPGPGRPAGDA